MDFVWAFTILNHFKMLLCFKQFNASFWMILRGKYNNMGCLIIYQVKEQSIGEKDYMHAKLYSTNYNLQCSNSKFYPSPNIYPYMHMLTHCT
jgi:hypothetical protein